MLSALRIVSGHQSRGDHSCFHSRHERKPWWYLMASICCCRDASALKQNVRRDPSKSSSAGDFPHPVSTAMRRGGDKTGSWEKRVSGGGGEPPHQLQTLHPPHLLTLFAYPASVVEGPRYTSAAVTPIGYPRMQFSTAAIGVAIVDPRAFWRSQRYSPRHVKPVGWGRQDSHTLFSCHWHYCRDGQRDTQDALFIYR